MIIMHRGIITELTANGAYVEIPKMAAKVSFGPIPVIQNEYSWGDQVLVTTVSNVKDDMVIIGKITTDAREKIIDGNLDSGWVLPDGVLLSGNVVKPATSNTVNRPNAVESGAGAMAYDTTLSKPIWSDGTYWRDATGTRVIDIWSASGSVASTSNILGSITTLLAASGSVASVSSVSGIV